MCVCECMRHRLLIGIILWNEAGSFLIRLTCVHVCDYLWVIICLCVRTCVCVCVCVCECAGDITRLSCLFSSTPGWPGLIRCPDYPAWPATINPSETSGPLNNPILHTHADLHTHSASHTLSHIFSIYQEHYILLIYCTYTWNKTVPFLFLSYFSFVPIILSGLSSGQTVCVFVYMHVCVFVCMLCHLGLQEPSRHLSRSLVPLIPGVLCVCERERKKKLEEEIIQSNLCHSIFFISSCKFPWRPT